MSKPRRRAGKGGIDRFGTHAWIMDSVPEIVAGSGYAAVVLLVYLWDKSFPPDGRTKGDVRISALARAIGGERKTVRAALAYLTEQDWITATDDGEAYIVAHVGRGSEQDDSGE